MSATPSLWRRKSDMLSLWRRFVPTPPIFIREIILWKRLRCRNDSMSTPALSNQWRSPSKVYPKMHRSSYLHITPASSCYKFVVVYVSYTFNHFLGRTSGIIHCTDTKNHSQFSIVAKMKAWKTNGTKLYITKNHFLESLPARSSFLMFSEDDRFEETMAR